MLEPCGPRGLARRDQPSNLLLVPPRRNPPRSALLPGIQPIVNVLRVVAGIPGVMERLVGAGQALGKESSRSWAPGKVPLRPSRDGEGKQSTFVNRQPLSGLTGGTNLRGTDGLANHHVPTRDNRRPILTRQM